MPTKTQGQYTDADLADSTQQGSTPTKKWMTDADLADHTEQGSTPAYPAGTNVAEPSSNGALHNIGRGILNLGKGAAKGALSTIFSGDDWARKNLPAFMTNSNFGFGPPANLERVHEMATPRNTAQSIGKGIEQAGEFLIPGGAEERAVTLMPKALQSAGRIAMGALSSGAVNKLQGGSFGVGALTGAGTGIAGAGARAIAPSLFRTLGKGISTDAARAALEDTTAVQPIKLEQQLNQRVGALSNQFNRNASGKLYSMAAPRAEVRQMVREANFANSPQQQSMVLNASAPLFSEFKNGKFAGGLPPQIDAVRARALKQAVGDTVRNFGPGNQDAGSAIGKRLYGAINQELHRVVPGGPELDERMSQLIPVQNTLKGINSRQPSIVGDVMGRLGARTGALSMPMAEAMAGAARSGLRGGLTGGLAGLIAPAVLSAPAAKVAGARMLFSPTTSRMARAGAVPLVDWIRKQNAGDNTQ